MTAPVAPGAFRILVTTLEALLAIQEQCMAQPDSDEEADQLFNEVQDVIERIKPVVQRLCAEPDLPPSVAAFLAELEMPA